MTDSMAQRERVPTQLDLSSWKVALCTISAVLLSLLFLVSGVWKISSPFEAAARMAQAQLPQNLSMLAAVGVGILETFAGVLILVPRFRRWGAWLTGFLLVVFMIYIGAMYNVLRGADCSCFPWVKRAVGPVFFISDAAMLLLAILAARWSKPPTSRRSAVVVLAAVAVFALLSYGMNAARRTGLRAPDSILVDGKPYSLQEGNVLVFFFNPECSHCDAVARELAKLNWGETKLVGVSTELHQFGGDFLRDTGLHGALSQDIEKMRKTFKFGDPPYAVALKNGREVGAYQVFTEMEPANSLRKIGFVK